ncbi:MAG: transglycosylase domain-containing protein [Mycobacterium leprae]
MRHARTPRERLWMLLAGGTMAGVLVAGLALPVVGGVGLVARAGAQAFQNIDPTRFATPPLPQRSRLLAADGSLIAQFYDENRVVVPLRQISPALRAAVVSIEDARFYEHSGVDVKGTARALVTNSRAGEVRQGGSTLTQQYVKNILVETATTPEARQAARERSLSRKVREVRYGSWLEQHRTKDQILEGYLSIAYFGGGAYGAEAAARHYFNKPAARLTLPEAALLAGVVRSPGSYDPVHRPRAAIARRNVVLARMAELGHITPAEAQRAAGAPLRLTITPERNGCATAAAPFFCEYVVDHIANNPAYGATREQRVRLLLRGGLTVRTTLDWKVQRAAQNAVDGYVGPGTDYGAAIAIVEPGTGAVKAIAQNHPWGDKPGQTTLNYATDQAHGGSHGFQAGSTFKIFTLAAALRAGIPVDLTIYSPNAASFTGFHDCATGAAFPPYPVANADVRESGSFDLRRGTWDSVNTFFVQLEQRTGVCAPAELAEAMGVRKATGQPLDRVPSFTLGTAEVTPLAMAGAYATFAASGSFCPPVPVTSVVDGTGRPLALPPTPCRQVLEPGVANTVGSILQGVIDGPDGSRTGRAASIGRPAAGKTGTVQDYAGAWFAGYTPQLAGAVWVGHPKGGVRYPLRGVRLGGTYYSRVYGGTLPAPIWASAMRGALEGTPVKDLPPADTRVVSGNETVVPDVRGLAPDAARATLERAGLAGGVGWSVASRLPRGLVARTSPRAGAQVPAGTRVAILVSTGVPPAPLPPPAQSPATAPTASGETPSATTTDSRHTESKKSKKSKKAKKSKKSKKKSKKSTTPSPTP